MNIYLDIILVENLLMNYIIIYATGVVMKKHIRHARIIIASLVGSLYAIVVYLNITKIVSNLLMKFILSVIMIVISFVENNYKTLLKDILMFYLISFVFGGCSIALIYFINPKNVKIHNGVLVGMYPIKVTLIAGVIAFIIIQIAFKITKNKLSTSDMICTVEVYINDRRKKVKVLIDSGNMLKDPINGYPVIIIEQEKIADILPKEVTENISVMQGGDINNINEKFISKIRLIPFSSLGKENGMLVGIKVEKIKIIFKENENIVNNVIVGIYNKKITKENTYNGLIGLDLLEKEESLVK